MATASPLTMDSSTESFHTPTGGSPANAEDDTTLSSPGEPATDKAYRDVRELPHELKENVRILLEEKMFGSAIHLLESLLSPGISRPTGPPPAVWLPPATQIAMLASFAIHPDMTSRVTDNQNITIAARSLRYLRELLAIVGPMNANLRTAFEFTAAPRGGRRVQHNNGDGSRNGSPTGYDDVGSDDDRVHQKFARQASIWTSGQDFWRVVGWAFNCSAAHPHRWRYWRPWLEFMIEVLEADFDEREKMDKERQADATADRVPLWALLEDALIINYANCSNRMSLKMIVKAIMADGSKSSLATFPEVFPKELKLASESNKRKRAVTLDLENNQYGDYLDDANFNSSQDSEPGSPVAVRNTAASTRPTARQDKPPALTSGYEESVPLRLRLWFLVARSAQRLPQRLDKLHVVYDTFADAIRELPVPHFACFVNSSPKSISDAGYVALFKNVVAPHIPRTAPKPVDVDFHADEMDGISVPLLEKCYLPFAANSSVLDINAKLSLVVENLLRTIWSCSDITWTEGLQRAVEEGVEARNDKTKPKKIARLKGDNDEELARVALRMSGERMLTLMKVMKMEYDSDEESSLTSYSSE